MIHDKKKKKKLFAGIFSVVEDINNYDSLTHTKTINYLRTHDNKLTDGFAIQIGIDDFKTIINKFGYNEGNVIIKNYANKLLEYCNHSQGEKELYRYVGDEFIILYKNPTITPQLAFNEIEKCVSYVMGTTQSFKIDISAGAVFIPNDASDYEELLKRLEQTYEYAKTKKRGSLVIYCEEITKSEKEETDLIFAIKDSIDNNFAGFELQYQPLVNPKNCKIEACEALLRFRNESVPNVDTYQIIKAIEKIEAMGKVGHFIIESAFKSAAYLQEKGKNIRIGINISYQQIISGDFADYLINKAKEYKVDPKNIALELTENYKIENYEFVSKEFKKLRDFGFLMVLDDFGVEFSNLELINKFDFQTLKVDKQFVKWLSEKDIKKSAIVESIFHMCSKIGINVVVEGVETKEVLDMIKEYPVKLIQGYYYSKALTLSELEELSQYVLK